MLQSYNRLSGANQEEDEFSMEFEVMGAGIGSYGSLESVTLYSLGITVTLSNPRGTHKGARPHMIRVSSAGIAVHGEGDHLCDTQTSAR